MRRALPLLVTALLALAAPALAHGQEPWSYPADPTDQLTVEGQEAGTEVTPEGNLYTGWAELGLFAGPDLAPWSQPVRTWQDGWLPVISGTRELGGVSYTLSAFSDDVSGPSDGDPAVPVDFVRMTAVNTSDVAQTARIASSVRYTGGQARPDGTRRFRFDRPVAFTALGLDWQLGASFSKGWSYRWDGDQLLRDDRLLAVVEPGTADPTSPAQVTSPTAPAGRAELSTELEPGQQRTFDVKLVVGPQPAGSGTAEAIADSSYDEHLREVTAHWRARLAPADVLEVPEPKAMDAYRAGLVQILGSRYFSQGRWVQAVNALNYHAFWLRDAAVMTRALDLVGLHEPAEQNLRFFDTWRRPDGQYISRPEQFDGIGQAIWALSEHALRTRSKAFARTILPRIDAATTWIIRATARDRYGLLPASSPHDNELVSGGAHLFGDDMWAVAGLTSAARLAQLLGDRDRTLAYRTERNILRRTVRLRVAQVRGRDGGAIPPTVEPRADARDWGNLWAAWPDQVLDADAPAVTATIKRVRAGFREGLATYGPKQRLHSYLGFRVLETQLVRRDRAEVVQGLFDALAHTTSTHGAAEIMVPPTDPVQVDENLGPHGWFSAEYVELLRNSLVREEGPDLELFGAVPAGWVAPGKRVAARGAPTLFGKVTASMTGVEGGAEVTWSAALRDKAKLRLAFPPGVTGVAVDGRPVSGDRVLLPGRSGSLALTWTVPPTGASTLSYPATVERLRASLAATGRRAGR